MHRLDGKIALVTGAARGIGECVASTFAAEGAVVIATDVLEENLSELSTRVAEQGGHCMAKKLDVTCKEDWIAVRDLIDAEFSKLDIIVNCAGMEMVRELKDLTLDEYRLTQAVNTEPAIFGTQILLDQLSKAAEECKNGASIVNISSIAGLLGIPDQIAYNTSKGAVRHVSKSLAIEFAHHKRNIRVNSIHPGCINTPMLREAMEAWAETGKIGTNDIAKVEEAFAAVCPMNKIGEPSDIALGALYLASEESGFVTGIELVIDGGSYASWT
ncbi:MAG: SDR family oxidoreductase [Pseudomonadota bacterium]